MNDEEKLQELEQKRKEFGRWLFSQNCEFKAGVMEFDQIPEFDYNLPEIAFAGRSNVGKSSLVNALTGRKSVARTSNTPGRTQQLNFFSLGDRLMIVDLPGYGYAKASKTAKSNWNKLIINYLKGRPVLRRICLLIDSRHGIKDTDKEIMDTLDKVAVIYQIVLTKVDKTKGKELEKVIAGVKKEIEKRPAAFPVIMETSSVSKDGIEELRTELAAIADN
ncbi:MAG: YihA family ribosome biogenesis GTP-binding protein [Alphaproteobacteria bacterium]|nr:YihA family ribosome biogenesis GTP-binding protein [Alphaproteobacteria bacterium]